MQACDKEVRTLFEKGIFKYAMETEVPDNANIPPLMWILSYKFDWSGYLFKHKARIVARVDLEFNQEDTYASTLAAQTFLAVASMAAAFYLEMKQYDAVNDFANAKLLFPAYCRCPKGYEKEGHVMIMLQAINSLQKSPLL